ncbi:sugar ABC transporter permease, partial [Ralstonia pickettii]|nr:sugar ABC transporter permease [Ralstonia pickettii]
MSELIREDASRTKKFGKFKRLVPYLFITPFFLLFSVFMLYPIIYSLVLSFSNWTAGNMTFIG